jgi:2-oxo-4-hydroxy-4-carboxy-5-ureidoimidazoline decarboxylase
VHGLNKVEIMSQRISLDALNKTDKAEFIRLLDGLFEATPWVAEKAFASRPFATVAAVHDAMMAAVVSLPKQEQIVFVSCHPDLAGKAARAGAMAPASIAEQAGLGLDRLSDDEFRRFEKLNADYRAKFGFPFVICVRRQTRDAVLDAFERRLGNGIDDELAAALEEIGHITRLRLVDRVEGAGAPAVAGRLSTHVLDTYHGRPAAGVTVELFEVGKSARAQLVQAVTGKDGRPERPLVAEQPLRVGTYELLFHLGDYFRSCGVTRDARPFLDVVPVRFGMAEPEGHYHVPLVASPWSYSVYRGS